MIDAKHRMANRTVFNNILKNQVDHGYVVLFIGFLLSYYLFLKYSHGVVSDGTGYYAYLRSMVIDHDLDFHNDYRLLHVTYSFQYVVTKTGHLANIFSIGPAILWLPFFLIAHVNVYLMNTLQHIPVPLDGVNLIYLVTTLSGTVIYSFIGTVLLYRLLNRFFEQRISLVTVLFIWFGTNLLWYQAFEPSMSHALSFFTVTLYLYVYLNRDKHSLRHSALLGITIGLMCLIRWQNLLLASIIFFDYVGEYYRSLKAKNTRQIKILLKHTASIAFFALLAFTPQMLAWKIIFGEYLLIPQEAALTRGASFFTPQHPKIIETLFSSRNGLISWTPLTAAGILGLIGFYMKNKKTATLFTIAFILMLYFNSIAGDWWAGSSFGARRFTNTLPLLSFGLAAFIETASQIIQRKPVASVFTVLSFFVLFNAGFMWQLHTGALPMGDTVSFNEKIKNDIDIYYKYTGYPFSYPANIYFAMKYGVSPARYDLISGKYLYFGEASLSGFLDIGSPDDKYFIGRGWHAREKGRINNTNITSRWAKSEAALLFDVYQPFNATINIRAMPFTPTQQHTQTITVYLNNQQVYTAKMKRGMHNYTFNVDKDKFKSGVNELKFKFTYEEQPAKWYATSDTRELAVYIDYVHIEKR
jgi:hypothetical protein